MIPDELKKAKPMTGKERLGANRDSEYLGAEDIDPGIEPILTIDHIYNARVTLQRGKEQKDVITFREERVNGIRNVRPLIVNATNRKVLRKIYKAVDAQTLEGKLVQLYIDHNVRDPSTGEKTDGIRIKPKIPTPPRTEPIVCAECGQTVVGVGGYSAEDVAKINERRYGRILCAACSKKLSEANNNKDGTAEPEATELTAALREE
jgi:hypothetical protein